MPSLGTKKQGCCHSQLFSLSLAPPAPQGLALPQDGAPGNQVLAVPLEMPEAQVSCASLLPCLRFCHCSLVLASAFASLPSMTCSRVWALATAFLPVLCFSPTGCQGMNAQCAYDAHCICERSKSVSFGKTVGVPGSDSPGLLEPDHVFFLGLVGIVVRAPH